MALGEILKQKRLERGWTKEYIAERTHMMVRSIAALETENYKKIPAPIYGRGFIRHYCALLELDPQPLLDEYMAAVSGGGHPQPVTKPAIHDLPDRPIEPIHTGARRTLPPKTDPQPSVARKLVEPAEASFTAVPKPEIPPATKVDGGAVEETEAIPLVLDGGPLPPMGPSDNPTPPIGRAALADLVTPSPKRPRKEVISAPKGPFGIRKDAFAGRSIFGPQHPVPDPPNPQIGSLRQLSLGIAHSVCGIVTQATHPKVRRMEGRNRAFLTRRMLLQATLVFLALIGLTLLVFAFRYVFRMSAEAESETTAGSAAAHFEPRPVAPPSAPYFK